MFRVVLYVLTLNLFCIYAFATLASNDLVNETATEVTHVLKDPTVEAFIEKKNRELTEDSEVRDAKEGVYVNFLGLLIPRPQEKCASRLYEAVFQRGIYDLKTYRKEKEETCRIRFEQDAPDHRCGSRSAKEITFVSKDCG